MQYHHWYWFRILILTYWIGINHCIEKIDKELINKCNETRMDRIRQNWIQNRVRFIIKSIHQSINYSLVVYQSVTNHGFINLIIIVESNRMCLIPDSCSYLLYQSFFHISIFGWNAGSFNNEQTTQSIKCL